MSTCTLSNTPIKHDKTYGLFGSVIDAANFELWRQQYQANVIVDEIFKQVSKPEQAVSQKQPCSNLLDVKNFGNFPQLSSDDLISEIDQMDHEECQFHHFL